VATLELSGYPSRQPNEISAFRAFIETSSGFAGSHLRNTGSKGEYLPRNKFHLHPTDLTCSTVMGGGLGEGFV
jgi:hypothetical protein